MFVNGTLKIKRKAQEIRQKVKCKNFDKIFSSVKFDFYGDLLLLKIKFCSFITFSASIY